jgi:hypothetical protein
MCRLLTELDRSISGEFASIEKGRGANRGGRLAPAGLSTGGCEREELSMPLGGTSDINHCTD